MTNKFKWGPSSLAHREQLHPDLQRLADVVLLLCPFDLSLTDSHRGKEAQHAAYHSGASQLDWPNSKHNKKPSDAMHLDPYPINYKNPKKYYVLAGIVLMIAFHLQIDIRWGGDWDSDYDFTDQSFNDLSHWEKR